ncbi:MAG: ABC transporter substrate-binding protein [Rhodospirillaceae bacterium]|nr:ABC transporter substrate-binding protein [Rhodospirillaceae bacterium]
MRQSAGFCAKALGHLARGAAAAAMVLAVSSTASAEFSPELKQVIAAAQKEGAIRLSWGTTVMGGAAGARVLEAGVNKMFGTNIKVTYLPGANMAQLGMQVATEAKAGRAAATDLLIGVTQALPTLVKQKALLAVDWQKLLPDRIKANLVEENGTIIKYATLPFGIIYNTKLVPNPPRTLKALLDPAYKGKIVTTPYAAGIDLLSATDALGPDKALDFIKQFAGQLGGLLRCTDYNRIASGEFAIFALDCGSGGLELKEMGMPVEVILPEDFVVFTYFYLTVPVNAKSPNAAKLFALYMLSEEGQKFNWDTWRTDLHLLPGSHSASRIAAVTARGAKPVEASMTWYGQHPEIDRKRGEIIKLLRSGR